MSRNVDLILVGAGPMAISYSQVLREKNIVFDVIGRGEISAKQFEEKTSIRPFIGLQEYLQSNSIPKDAIVATGVDTLAFCTEILISAGIKNILLEKPGALMTEQLNSLHQLADTKKARVLIAYNRRSYASTTKARQMIEEDGGLREIYFEFTEWADVVESSNKLAAVKKKWFLANSTHVVDLAFHFAGLPRQWSHFTSGGSDWHPSATRFAGSGVTERDVLFTYNADWESAGRWGVELLTSQRRLFLRPMEQLFSQKKNSLQIEPESINDELDKKFKPGLFKQVSAFLDHQDELACTLEDQVKHLDYFNLMAGYAD